jgi:hypothetical protein
VKVALVSCSRRRKKKEGKKRGGGGDGISFYTDAMGRQRRRVGPDRGVPSGGGNGGGPRPTTVGGGRPTPACMQWARAAR